MTTTSSTSSTSSLSSLLSALSSGTTSSSDSSSSSSSTTGSSGSTLSTSSSGATVSIPGLGTGLDVSSIVTALVNAEKAPKQSQIDTQTSLINTQASGLSSLQSALESLQSAVSGLTASGTYNTFDASLSSSDMGSATTTSGAVAGSYALQVSQLATAQSRTSDAVASGTSLGSGSLQFKVGSQSVSISVTSGQSLSDVADAINGAAGNPGITATVVNGTDGAHLMVTSTQTGKANGFSVSSSGSAALSSLASQLDTAGSNEAQDAVLKINGIEVDSASNTVSGAIRGVSVTLTATGSTTLDVKADNSTATTAVQNFVTAYNSYASTVSSLSAYDTSSKASGALLGNPVLNSIRNQVNSIISGLVSNNSIGSLAQLGITRNADGTLALDSSTLASALSNNASQVQDLFAGSSGYATKLNAAITSFTASNGIIANQQTSLQSQLTSLSSQQTALNKRMAVYQSQLSAEYTNLSTLMSSLNQTSNYLTQLSDQQNKSSS